jgi:hypothetical protein
MTVLPSGSSRTLPSGSVAAAMGSSAFSRFRITSNDRENSRNKNARFRNRARFIVGRLETNDHRARWVRVVVVVVVVVVVMFRCA